eukprot:1223649-Prymnesium_polylepis.1
MAESEQRERAAAANRARERMAKRPRSHASDDEFAGGGLGDIMGGAGLGHTELRQPLEHFTPLQRIVLSANGNLQRLLSSYYNSPVTVNARQHDKVAEGEYLREVEISVHGIIFCVARSLVKITRPEVIAAIEGGVAIGQLFRHLSILPSFSLHTAAFLGDVRWRHSRLATSAQPPLFAAPRTEQPA